LARDRLEFQVMAIILQRVPTGEKVGIAFSGGLDTEISDGDSVTILPAVAGG